MRRFKELVREAHRRSLWQVLGVYLALSWVVLQVIEVLTTNMGLPDWVPPFAIVLLLIGLPVVVGTAFVQEGVGSETEGAPEPSGSAPSTVGDAGGKSRPAPEAGVEPAPATARGTAEPASGAAVAGPAGRSRRHSLLTWRNALVGGALGFALLGVLTGGYMLMRTLGIGPAGTLVAKGVLDERDRIALADFASTDSLLARAATEAFRVDLSQSRVVGLVERRFVADALSRMERDPNASLDRATALELARREGIKAVLAGEITPAGQQFVLSAQLVEPASREILVAHRETAEDSTDIVPSIDRLSKKLRERIGESLRTINLETPLEKVTTGNLEALRKYSQGIRVSELEGDFERALALFEEAVALDSGFAMGWRGLGIELANLNQERGRYVEAFTRAYEHRDRLTERERYLTMASYFSDVTGERSKAINAYESVLDLDPEDNTALNNIAVLYTEMRDYARAEEFYRQAIEADSSRSIPYTNTVIAQVAQGKIEEAHATLEAYRRRFPGNPVAEIFETNLTAAAGDYEMAEENARRFMEEHADNLIFTRGVNRALTALMAVRGRLAEAEEFRRRSEETDRRRGLASEALGTALWAGWHDLLVREDTARAIRTVEDALERYPLEKIDPLDRPYTNLANFHALAGRPARARAFVEAFKAEVSVELRREAESDIRWSEAAIRLAEGRAEEAARELRAAEEGPCTICGLPMIGLAHDRAGQADSAIAVMERYIETPWLWRMFPDNTSRARILERLGELYDERGDLENAAKYYAMFVDLWADADEELQPRVQAAQARLEEIVRARG